MTPSSANDAPIPTARRDDTEDVSWALSTAEAMYARGDRGDALKWLRRAAEAASEALDDDRALELAKAAADLATEIGPSRSAPPPAPVPVPVRASSAPPVAAPFSPASAPPPQVVRSSPPPMVAPPPVGHLASPLDAPIAPGVEVLISIQPASPPSATIPAAPPANAPLERSPLHSSDSVRPGQAETTAVTAPWNDELTPALAPPAPLPAAEARPRDGAMPLPPATPRALPVAEDMDAWPTQSIDHGGENGAHVEKTRIGTPAYRSETRRASEPSPARTSDPALKPAQAVRVVVWRTADGVRVAPHGTRVSAISIDAMLVALDPSADLAAWLSGK